MSVCCLSLSFARTLTQCASQTARLSELTQCNAAAAAVVVVVRSYAKCVAVAAPMHLCARCSFSPPPSIALRALIRAVSCAASFASSCSASRVASAAAALIIVAFYDLPLQLLEF